jgi:hypothetical protein
MLRRAPFNVATNAWPLIGARRGAAKNGVDRCAQIFTINGQGVAWAA